HLAFLFLGCFTLCFSLLSFVSLRGGFRLLPAAVSLCPACLLRPRLGCRASLVFPRLSAAFLQRFALSWRPGGDLLRLL
ncbi:hypothetical protein, partial [Klebsiella pneumoniae]|uniref:hypothetical protein n=1 Tax=Klebsiella pneumoniae TaxID=573 RepID=UPI003B5BE74E